MALRVLDVELKVGALPMELHLDIKGTEGRGESILNSETGSLGGLEFVPLHEVAMGVVVTRS